MSDIFYQKVMILSPYPERIAPIIEATGDRWQVSEDALSDHFDWYVSYGFRHIIREPDLTRHAGRIINLHISMLPWNRGADPNFWAWHDGTPHGVTVHYIDAGMDTGDIIAQREVPMGEETLASSYARLNEAMVSLFGQVWPQIRSGTAPRSPQPAGGSLHRSDQRPALPAGWDTPVAQVRRLRSDTK